MTDGLRNPASRNGRSGWPEWSAKLGIVEDMGFSEFVSGPARPGVEHPDAPRNYRPFRRLDSFQNSGDALPSANALRRQCELTAAAAQQRCRLADQTGTGGAQRMPD